MRKLRFSDAVASIECPPKSLRKTLQNPKLVLPSPSRDGWAEFSPIQLALLAVIRRLVDFGFTVERASLTACMSVVGAFAGSDREDGSALTAGQFLQLLQREYLVCYTIPGEFDPIAEHRQSDGWPQLSDQLQQLAVLVVPIGAVVARCFARAPVLPEDDMTGSDNDVVRTMLQFRKEFYEPGSDLPTFVMPAVLPDSRQESSSADEATAKAAGAA